MSLAHLPEAHGQRVLLCFLCLGQSPHLICDPLRYDSELYVTPSTGGLLADPQLKGTFSLLPQPLCSTSQSHSQPISSPLWAHGDTSRAYLQGTDAQGS